MSHKNLLKEVFVTHSLPAGLRRPKPLATARRRASGQTKIKNNQMKKTFVYPAALLLLSVLMISCKKEQVGRSLTPLQPNQSINASVASGETFTFVAGSTGSLSVSKQALHFQISEAVNENGSVYYNYKPVGDYIGSDEVALMYLSDVAAPPGISTSTGCPESHNTPSSAMSTIVIKLTVTK